MVSTPIIHLRVHSRSRRKDAGFREEKKSFSSSPPRPKKEEKSVWPRHSGHTLFINLGWGLAANRSDFCEALMQACLCLFLLCPRWWVELVLFQRMQEKSVPADTPGTRAGMTYIAP